MRRIILRIVVVNFVHVLLILFIISVIFKWVRPVRLGVRVYGGLKALTVGRYSCVYSHWLLCICARIVLVFGFRFSQDLQQAHSEDISRIWLVFCICAACCIFYVF